MTEILDRVDDARDLRGLTYDQLTTLAAEIRHFLECIQSGNEPITSGRNNLGTMAVVDALYQAGETKSVVKVEKTQL